MSSLTTTAAEKQVVILLVGCRGICSIPDGHRSSLDGHDNGFVTLVGKDVTLEAVKVPTETVRIVEAILVHPVPVPLLLLVIGVCGH